MYIPALSCPYLQATADTQIFPSQQLCLGRALAFVSLVLQTHLCIITKS